MIQSMTGGLRCTVPSPLPVEASFDGGLAWLSEAEETLGLCAAFAAVIPDWRTGPVRHSLETLLRQRVFQIACGYEDQDDADTLRSDPDLASQPTFSRLENAVDRKACYRLAQALLAIYLRSGRAPVRPPGSCSILMGPMIPLMGTRKAPPTMATFVSTCTTPCCSSMAIPTS